MSNNLPESLNYSKMYYGLQNLENVRFFPSTVHLDSKLTKFHYRYLMQRAISKFKWKLPEYISRNYFIYTMYVIGYGFVFKSEEYGTLFNHGTLDGYDVFYQPAYAVIQNPLFKKTYTLRIGEECAIIKLNPDYHGISDICRYYAELLAMAGSALQTNLINSKFAYIFGSKNQQVSQTFKKLYDDIASGEPAVFADKKLYDDNGNLSIQIFSQDVKSTYIGDQLLTDIRNILNDFDSIIGINNANTEKKERMLTDEVNANNFETNAISYVQFDTLQDSIKKSNEMYPDYKIEVSYRKEDNATNGEQSKGDSVDNVPDR